MVIVSRKAIHEYASTKPQATEALNEWYLKTKAADWSNLADVKNTFNSVDYVGNDNYVFNRTGGPDKRQSIPPDCPDYLSGTNHLHSVYWYTR